MGGALRHLLVGMHMSNEGALNYCTSNQEVFLLGHYVVAHLGNVWDESQFLLGTEAQECTAVNR